MVSRSLLAALCVLAPFTLTTGTVLAQSAVLAESHTIVGTNAATRVAPVERNLTITKAATYTLTLSDLKLPAAFDTVTLAVTSGASLVATATVTGGGSPAVAQFTASAAGTYVVHVVGGLSGSNTFGTFGVQLASTDSTVSLTGQGFVADDGSVAPSLTARLSLPKSALPSGTDTINTTFTITAAGQYELDLTDLNAPQALGSLMATLVGPDGNAVTGFPLLTAGKQTFAAVAGTYTLGVIAQSASGAQGGLYNVRVFGGSSGADVFNVTDPLGQVFSVGTATLPTGQYSLALTDFAFPTALSQSGAFVTLNDKLLACSGSACGSISPTLTVTSATTYPVFALAIPSTATSIGSYGITLTASGSGLAFSSIQTTPSVTGGVSSYTYGVDIANAGDYNLRLTDFKFPQAFGSLSMVAAQNGALVSTAVAGSGTSAVTLAAGKLYVLIAAQPAASGSGVFGLDLSPKAGGTAAFTTTQGVGASFHSTPVSITSAGSYDVTVSDLSFPVKLTDLSAVVTQGGTTFGSIFSGGTITFTATSAGTYFINFLGTPAAIKTGSSQTAGTYGVSVAPTPAPTVSLSASATQVTSGGTVTLTWSSQNATSCSASGGWSGTLGTSGTQTSSAITASTTFTLTCTGPGGQGSASASVSLQSTQTSKGGGGSLDPLLIALLCCVAAYKLRRAAHRPG